MRPRWTCSSGAGIEAIPVMTELSENLQIAKDHGYGPSEEEVRRFAGYQREVTELEVSWERLKRNLEVPLVASVNFLFDGLKWLDFIASMPGKMFASQFLSGKSTAMDTEMAETGGWGYGASMSRSAHRAEVRSIAANDAMVAAARVSDEKNQQLELAEKKLSELQGELKTGVFPSVNQPVLDQIAKERQVIAGLKADAEAKKAAAEATKKFSEELKEAVKHADELRDKLTTKLLTGIEQTHPINREVEPNAPGGIVGQMLYGQAQLRLMRSGATRDQSADIADWWSAQKVSDEAHLGAVTHDLAMQERLLKLNLDGKNLVEKSYDLRKKAADEEYSVIEQTYALRKKAADEEYSINLKYQDSEAAANKRDEEYDKARITRQEELLDLQKKQRGEDQREQDAIAKTAGGLFHTLFTKPQSFPHQLLNTVHEAALKPLTETLGGAVGSVIHPVKADPLKVSTDINTAVTAQNSAAIGNLTAVVAAAAGVTAPGIAAVSVPGIGGISLPNISVGTPTGTATSYAASVAQRALAGLPRFAQGGITNGPSIAGENGPELIIPLYPQLDMRPTMNRPLVGQFGPATDAALEKAATALMSVALPMGLTALGGPGGFALGDLMMAGITGGVGWATPARHDNVMMGTVPPAYWRPSSPGAVEEAIQQAKDLGVRSVDFELESPRSVIAGEVEVLRKVARDIHTAMEHGADYVPGRVLVAPTRFGDASRRIAEVKSTGGGTTMIINPWHDSWRDQGDSMYEAFTSGHFSTGVPEQGVFHELGHVAHVNVIGQRAYASAGEMGFPFADAERQIAGNVSRYAMTNSHEFVAEVFAGKLSGRIYPEEVERWYKLLGGESIRVPANVSRWTREADIDDEEFMGWMARDWRPGAPTPQLVRLPYPAEGPEAGPLAAQAPHKVVIDPASYRVNPDVRRLTVNPEKPEFLFNKTEETIRAVGAKGGRQAALNARLRAAEAAEEKRFSDAIYTGPEPGPIETAHEAAMKLDEQFHWLKGIFDKTAADVARQARGRTGGSAGPTMVRVGDELMPLNDAAKLLDKSSDALRAWLRKNLSVQDLTAVDLLKAVTDKRKLPQYDDGGTVASTGVAVVHKGEAVVPQADTLKRSIDALTAAMQGNVGVMRWMVSSILSGRGTVSSMAGFSMPPELMAVAQGTVSEISAPAIGGGSTGAAAPYSVAQLATMPHTGTGANPLLGAIFGGGTTSQGGGGLIGTVMNSGHQGGTLGGFNPAQILKNIKSINLGGLTRSPVTPTFGVQAAGPGVSDTEVGSDVQTGTTGGRITGVNGLAGAALMAGGSMVATQGLLGPNMGTWGGTAEGAVGGGAVGFAMGGTLGAAIGAGVGFGIGVGEMLAGVETPQRKAHDDIKQIYGVDIPQNSGTIKQVVSIAQSQFGGDIAVAVRSPNVRQLVMLYSESTGQKMPVSASTPYAGSLVESGGNLYQQASFQNNAWHSYASNLPTRGGIAGTPYPTTPGPNTGEGAGATYLSLNINGTPITADYVADQSMAAQNASYGRTQQSANLQVPGLMVA
jgi:hypothetical protein